MPELDTLFKIGKSFGMTATDLLSLAERQTAQPVSESSHVSDGFDFREVSYANLKMLKGFAPAGAKVSRPEVHKDVYEVCWVLKGKVRITLPSEHHDLECGSALQFDAVLEHTYEAVEDTELIILHLIKGKRF